MSWAKSLLSLFPHPSSAPKGDIPDILACYGIPYGGLGFLSHVLTYYTMICLACGKKPLMPWKPIKESGPFSFITCMIGTLVGVILAIYTTAKCHAYWQLTFMGIWKIGFSTFNGLVGLVASPKPEGEEEISQTVVMVIGVGFYILSQIFCVAGIISLVVLSWEGHHARLAIVTYAFVGIVAATPILIVLAYCSGIPYGLEKLWEYWRIRIRKSDTIETSSVYTDRSPSLSIALVLCIPWTFVACGFYSDWALGAIQHDLLGRPSGDNKVVFWTYFVAKRFTMIAHIL